MTRNVKRWTHYHRARKYYRRQCAYGKRANPQYVDDVLMHWYNRTKHYSLLEAGSCGKTIVTFRKYSYGRKQ